MVVDAEEYVGRVHRAYSAFALLLTGPVSGVDDGEVAALVASRLITAKEAEEGFTLGGFDPFQLAVILGSILGDESSTYSSPLSKSWNSATDLRAASMKGWLDRVYLRVRLRQLGTRKLVGKRWDAPPHLTDMETAAWLSARTRAAKYITEMSESHKIAVRELVTVAVSEKWSRKELATALANTVNEYSRDWMRVARTELQGAFNDGVAASAYAKFRDKARIAFITESDACRHCIRLFRDADGAPVIFELSELIANGSNVGRKPDEWKATIWPIHPNCRCTPMTVPPGAAVTEGGTLRMAKSALDSLTSQGVLDKMFPERW